MILFGDLSRILMCLPFYEKFMLLRMIDRLEHWSIPCLLGSETHVKVVCKPNIYPLWSCPKDFFTKYEKNIIH